MKRSIILISIILQIHSALSQEKNVCDYWGSYYTELNDSLEHITRELSICKNKSFIITICDTYCNENWALDPYTGERLYVQQIYGTYIFQQDTILFYTKKDSVLYLKAIIVDSLNLRILYDASITMKVNTYFNRASKYSENHILGDHMDNIGDLRWFLNADTLEQKKIYKLYYVPEKSDETIFTVTPIIIKNNDLYIY